MPITKEAIAEVLNSLDHTNDAIWTDDGSPLVSEVQRLANDKTITRAQINDALPGFARKIADATANEDEPATGGEPELAPKSTVNTAPGAPFDDRMEPEVNGAGEPLSEDQVRAILTRRIRDAEQALTDARMRTSESRQEERKCEQRLARAHADHQRHYPAITAAENIKQHLESQQRQLRERVTGVGSGGGISQVDQAMQRSNKRGWTRPVHNHAAA